MNVANVWLMTHSYKLDSIQESDVEQNTSFI